MSMTEAPPIACTLAPSEFKDRLAWIGTLTRDALRSHERQDLVLDLRYAPEARERVREMVRNERVCCSFLTFDLRDAPDEVRLTVTAPEATREAADLLFEQFVAGGPAQSPCAGAEPSDSERVAAGAVACGACCVLPFALPAATFAGTGSILAWFADAHAWVTGLAILAVIGAWGWIAWQTVRTRCKPAASTLLVMAAATGLVVIAVLWPVIEPQLVRVLMM